MKRDSSDSISNEVASNYIIDVLIRCEKQPKDDHSRPKPCAVGMNIDR